MTFAEKIKKLRNDKSMTQEELAEIVFVSRVAVSKWETGRGYPNIDSLQQIAKVFDVSVDSLLSTADFFEVGRKERAKTIGLFNSLSFLLFILPFFRNVEVDGGITSVLVFNVAYSSPIIKLISLSAIVISAVTGLVSLCFTKVHFRTKFLLCVISNAVMVLVFCLTLQPYPAVFSLVILILNCFSGLRN